MCGRTESVRSMFAPRWLATAAALIASFFHGIVVSLAYVFGYTEMTLRARMSAARTYTEWKGAARLIDNARGFCEWRVSTEHRLYNATEVSRRIAALKTHMTNNDIAMLVEDFQYDFHRAMCGLNNPFLYVRYPSGTKSNVHEYVSTIARACKVIGDDTTVPLARKLDMIRHVTLAFGKSALILDSSAIFGAHTVGVIKALHEASALPEVIFGNGSAALVAAFACCTTDISRLFCMDAINFSAFQRRGSKGSVARKIKRLWVEGALMDITVLLQFAKDNIGELTFREAFERTGHILNVAVSVYHPGNGTRGIWLLNHLTARDVLIYTAACASCATPLLYPRCDILQRMPDGAIIRCEPATLRWSTQLSSLHVNDVMGRMRSLFGVNNFIVAEATMGRLPFLALSRNNLFTGAIAFFTEELWRLLAALSRLGPFRSRVTGILQAWCVPLTGDVVLYPVSTAGDVIRLLSNPDQALLDYCMWKGEQTVWPHLERIRLSLIIENSLRQLERRLAAEAKDLIPATDSPAMSHIG